MRTYFGFGWKDTWHLMYSVFICKIYIPLFLLLTKIHGLKCVGITRQIWLNLVSSGLAPSLSEVKWRIQIFLRNMLGSSLRQADFKIHEYSRGAIKRTKMGDSLTINCIYNSWSGNHPSLSFQLLCKYFKKQHCN